ncbi:rhodanese-like domain-containing protein [Terrimonas pollutisoli]|uniref:rhodanese-like domain-containing protein n=1 Tax=Terrimonas pollutisoli TaxID=3034147 RepID=UPI0034E00A51
MIDARSYIEFKMDHMEGAFNIPLHQLPARLNEIDRFKKDTIIFYCRGEQAVMFLCQHDIENIYNEGDID